MADPHTKTPAPDAPAARKRTPSVRRRVLWGIGLLLTTAFAVWQVTVFVLNQSSAAPLPPQDRFDQADAPPGAGGASGDSSLPLTKDPMTLLEGYRRVRSAPPFAPPPEARQISSLGREDPGREHWVWLIWVYQVPASAETMLGYARSVATSAGFQEQPLPDRPDALLLTRRGEITHVAVQRLGENLTRLSITTQRAGRPDDF